MGGEGGGRGSCFGRVSLGYGVGERSSSATPVGNVSSSCSCELGQALGCLHLRSKVPCFLLSPVTMGCFATEPVNSSKSYQSHPIDQPLKNLVLNTNRYLQSLWSLFTSENKIVYFEGDAFSYASWKVLITAHV